MFSWFMRQVALSLTVFVLASAGIAGTGDLDQIRRDGVLRHLGIPYANFVTGAGDGLDVELVRGFAESLGVRYEFVETNWSQAFGDLTGRHARRTGRKAERFGNTPVRGDLIANGMTVLDWRAEVVDFSEPTFPSGVWLIAQAESPLSPINPTGLISSDIIETKARLPGVSVLALTNTCLDPGLYNLEATSAEIRLLPKERKLNEMIPALLNNDGETTLLDVPDALIALQRWPGRIKVIGPISDDQQMAVAFRPSSPELRTAFNKYLAGTRANGDYARLVEKYYPSVFDYFPGFFD
ncbi:MAG: transporter substrate-binding domain-containing protein [Gammaproteobacteria bacterium]|nr:transporter substrate-binding domain-containing protein [Gammaproteobacteria bacterium]